MNRTPEAGRLGLFVTDLEAAGLACPTVTYDRGQEILRQGDQGDFMIVIRSGSVTVSIDGSEIAVLGPGETVGEMALVDDAPRNATAMAREQTAAIQIDRKAFIRLRTENARFVGEIMRIMAERIRRTSAQAAAYLPQPKAVAQEPAAKPTASDPEAQASPNTSGEVRWC